MSELERDVGQLLWVGFDGTTLPDDMRERVASGQVGGAVLFARNVGKVTNAAAAEAAGATTPEAEVADVDALVALVDALHAAATAAGDPLLVAVDQEGGRVQRVRAPAPRWPPMLALDRVGDEREATRLAFACGVAVGAELAALGFDVDFAPVLDIHTNADNPIIGDRALGTRPDTVVDRALAFARGLDSEGVLPCGKHYPGHGDTTTDSHLELPRVDHDLDRLRAIELAPFARAAAENMPLIMTAHVVFAALDADRPATLSPAALGLLRNELGFAGVIVSDDLDMKALRDHFGTRDAAVQAVRAGCDVLLACNDRATQTEAYDALLAAATADSDFRARVADAARRVRALKRTYLDTRPLRAQPSAAYARDVLASESHHRLAARLREA